MIRLSAQTMSGLLTPPYRRGAETMEIPLGADAGGFTIIPAYDFKEYQARHQTPPPEPKYVLLPLKDLGTDEMIVEVEFSSGGVIANTAVKVPARTFAGVSFVIPLPAGADAKLRLLRLRQLPLSLSGPGAENWAIVALLGNISKLTWILGREKDEIRQQIRDVQRQRSRSFAYARSLDLLGSDLRVPRFPPREHSFDRNTLALYHLNELTASNGPVADETVRFGAAGHPGVNQDAVSGANGKFGNGFSFPGPSGSGAILISDHADFDIADGVDDGFTVEAFVKTADFDDPAPRIVLMKRAQEIAGPLVIPGWSLSLGSFRGIHNNVMWAVGNGGREVKVFADVNLGDEKFHHLAGTVDRAGRRARLFVDGEERASGDIDGFGVIGNNDDLLIGRSPAGNQFVGVIDEVRLSNKARSDFHPVLGEGDPAYRQRLGIFERWLLPTPDSLLKTINELVQINDEAESFKLIEKDRPATISSKILRILPAAVSMGQQIDREGRGISHESDISGVPLADTEFNRIYLLRDDRAQINYAGGENSRLMQAVTRAALDTLVNLLVAAGTPGKLNITKSFDPADAGLHSVGRALRLTHETLALEELGVLVHQAGFDFVRNDGAQIYASVAAGEKLEVVIEPHVAIDTPPEGIDVFIGKAIDLHIGPETLPANGSIDWTIIPCDAGRAHFEKHPADAAALRRPVTSRSHLRLVADAPGEVTVRVEYTLDRQTVSGTRTILINIESLADGETIAANGDTRISEAAAAGTPEAVLNPTYLVTSNADVSFGAAANNRRMQIVLEKPFLRLVALLESIGAATNQLSVLKAFDPADAGLHGVARAIRFGHNVLDAGTLGALAHRAGFDFVRRTGSEIFAAMAEGEKIEIIQSSDLLPLADEVKVGVPRDIEARFEALPGDGNFNWSLQQIGEGEASLNFVLRPKVRLTPRKPGLLAINVSFLEDEPQSTFPYTFEIRLNDALDLPGTIIPKHQYDLLMNVLNYFHPIGVEVLTRNIREHVVELQGNLLNAFPGYTYPDFRS